MKPVVSVIIPTFNQSAFIGKALDSVFAQTMVDFEIIVVDNGSTDKTAEIVKSYTDSRLLYFHQQNSGSPVSPRNRAMDIAKGEFIAFLDSDDLWMPDKLQLQVDRLTDNTDVALVFSDYHFIDVGDVVGNNWFSSCRPHRGNVFSSLLRQNFIPNSTAMVRSSVVEKIGLLEEEFRICHDLDFYLRIAASYPVDFIDASLARLRIHGASLTTDRARMHEEIIEVNERWRTEVEERDDINLSGFERIQASYHLRAGLYSLAVGDRQRGKDHLRTAAGKRPLNAIYWLAYIFSLLAAGVFGRIFNLALRRKGAVINGTK